MKNGLGGGVQKLEDLGSDSDDEYLTSDSEAPEYLLAPKAKKRRYVLEL